MQVAGGLAAVIVVLEGVQHLYQFQERWITYCSTAEALKHERYLYWATLTALDPARCRVHGLVKCPRRPEAEWFTVPGRPVLP